MEMLKNDPRLNKSVQYTTLNFGSTGDEVRKLQEALGFTGADVDGIYGQKTQQAVRDYQKNNNLAVDGIAGQQTLSSIYKTSSGEAGDESGTSSGYQPTWADAAQQYLQQYQDREPFSYDFVSDALYQQYADQYANSAKLAMQDTMGQAAAMTGGYGNTWAQSVGQQAYNQQMSQLNNIIPELEQRAYDRYQQEGNDLLTQYSIYQSLEDAEYAKWRDEVADQQWQAQFDEAVRQYDQSYALSAARAYSGGNLGGNPDANPDGNPGGGGNNKYNEVLGVAKQMAAAGKTVAEVHTMLEEAIKNKFITEEDAEQIVRSYQNISQQNKTGYNNVLTQARNMLKSGKTHQDVYHFLSNEWKKGNITLEQYQHIMDII